MWPPEIDLVETNGQGHFTMTYHYGSSNNFCQSSTVTSVNLQHFNVFELKWSATAMTLYANGTQVALLNDQTGGNCAGAPFPHVGMTFDFDQENTFNNTIGNTNQQSDLAWVAMWNA